MEDLLLDAMHRDDSTVAQARVCVGDLEQFFTQLRNDVQNNGLDQGAIHQRLTQFVTEDQRRETGSRNSLEQRMTQLRHDFQSALVDHDTTFNRIAQEF